MASAPHPAAEPTFSAVHGNAGVVSSGMFAGAQHLVVTARKLKNITKNYTVASEPSDFRMFPMGDIDLRREICLDKDTRVVSRGGWSNRRMYSAKLQGKNVTIAMYHGDGAAGEWRKYMKAHYSLRHPNIVQIYGTARLCGIHATIFHGDLIPIQDCVDLYRNLPCATAYIHTLCSHDYAVARDYLFSIFFHDPCLSMWIRRSTGRVCVELVDPDERTAFPIYCLFRLPVLEETPLFSGNASDMEAIAIDALPLEDYHEICCWSMGHWHSSINTPTNVSVSMGAVVSRYFNDQFIASLPDVCVGISSWISSKGQSTVLANGWARFNAHDAVDCHLCLSCRTRNHESWLTQANYIFDCCQITSGMEDYVCLLEVNFRLHVSAMTAAVPAGFLFLCPPDDFRTEPSGSFCWPDCPAYWALDPMGIGRLSTEEAREFGFPELTFSTTICGRYWDASVYAGLRKFHQAKGFDPYSQDLARHLGRPLYRPFNDIHAPFAHIDDGDTDDNLETDVQDRPMDVDDNETEPNEDFPGMDLSW